VTTVKLNAPIVLYEAVAYDETMSKKILLLLTVVAAVGAAYVVKK